MKKLVLLSIIFSTLIGLSSFVYGAVADEEQTYVTYKVQQGDTLWSIAKQYLEPNENIRSLVYDIKKANDIGALLQPGQALQIPVKQQF